MFVDLGHAALAVLAFLGASVAFLVSLSTAGAALLTRRFKLARRMLTVAAIVAAIYTFALFAFAAFSKEYVLARGVEKHFCEVDCHVAYSLTRVDRQADALAVTVRARFDEKTISERRSRTAPLTPNPRDIYLVDNSGRQIAPDGGYSGQLERPLIPGDAYDTIFRFRVPPSAQDLKLYIRNASFPNAWLIDHENSPGHKKVYFALQPTA
jgi:hypothetical protein